MKLVRTFAALALLVTFSGCASFDAAAQDVAGLFSHSTPAQANTVAAAESLYTAADKAATAGIKQHVVTVDVAMEIANYDNQVYKALVDLRTAVQNGNSAAIPALLDAFNAVYANFSTELTKNGIAISNPGTAT